MMRLALIVLIVCIQSASSAQSDEALIRKVLDDQVEAWNRGDIEGYMAGYWNSDSTLFSSGGNFIRGHHEVLNRYKKSYGTAELRGKLEFSELEVRRLSSTFALAVGVWRLRRSNDNPWGRFTLILQKKNEGWRITADHTSVGE